MIYLSKLLERLEEIVYKFQSNFIINSLHFLEFILLCVRENFSESAVNRKRKKEKTILALQY